MTKCKVLKKFYVTTIDGNAYKVECDDSTSKIMEISNVSKLQAKTDLYPEALFTLLTFNEGLWKLKPKDKYKERPEETAGGFLIRTESITGLFFRKDKAFEFSKITPRKSIDWKKSEEVLRKIGKSHPFFIVKNSIWDLL